MCQWPVRCQQYKAWVKPQPPPTTLMPGPLGALLCRKYTFDSHSCRPLPKLGQVGSTSLRQTAKWVRRTETYPGPLLVTDTPSPDLRASRRPEMAPTTPRGQPGSWVGTGHQALTGFPPTPSPRQLSISRFPMVLIHLTISTPPGSFPGQTEPARNDPALANLPKPTA